MGIDPRVNPAYARPHHNLPIPQSAQRCKEFAKDATGVLAILPRIVVGGVSVPNSAGTKTVWSKPLTLVVRPVPPPWTGRPVAQRDPTPGAVRRGSSIASGRYAPSAPSRGNEDRDAWHAGRLQGEAPRAGSSSDARAPASKSSPQLAGVESKLRPSVLGSNVGRRSHAGVVWPAFSVGCVQTPALLARPSS